MLSNPPFGVTWGGKDGYAHVMPTLKRDAAVQMNKILA